jgi:hypothetical protein
MKHDRRRWCGGGDCGRPGPDLTGGPARPAALLSAGRDRPAGLLYLASGTPDEVLGQSVRRVGRTRWSVNLAPEVSLLAAADAMMKAAHFRPC